MAKRYILSTEIDRIRGKHPDFELQLPAVPADGDLPALKQTVVKVTPPQRWTDEISRLAQTNPIAAAKLLIGEDGYDHMIRAGGSSAILFTIVNENAGADTGESSAS